MLAISFLEQAAFITLFLFLTQKHLPERSSLGVAFAGFVIAAFVLTKLAAQGPAGWAADRIGYRSALVIGLSATVIASVLMMQAQQSWLFLAATGLYALGKAPVSPSLNATVANLVSEDHRGKAVSFLNIAGLSAMIAAGLGGFLLLDWMTVRAAFAISIALSICAVLVALFFVQETSVLATAGADGRRRDRTPLRELVTVQVSSWAGIVLLLGMGIMMPMARPYFHDELGMRSHEMVPYLILPGIVAVASIIPCGHLADRLGRMRPLALGLSVGVAGLFGLTITTSLFAIMGLISLIMLSWTMTSPAVGAALMDVTREETRGMTLGLLGTVQGLGGAFGPALGGGIYQVAGAQQVFMVAGCLLGAALLLAAFYVARQRPTLALQPSPA